MNYVGIDLHQKSMSVCVLSPEGKVLSRFELPTNRSRVESRFGRISTSRIILESGGSSGWVARLLESLGHEVVVASARHVSWIAQSSLKTDRIDAEILARLLRSELALIRPSYVRSEAAQLGRCQSSVRAGLVRNRTRLINQVRGLLRQYGLSLPSGSSSCFVSRYGQAAMDPELRGLLDPLVEVIAVLSAQIEKVSGQIRECAADDELLTRLQSVPGVGPIVAFEYVHWMDDASRFRNSRDVGACLGLRPRVRCSGQREWHGRITKEGDGEMRRLLVQAAHAAFRCRAESKLMRWAKNLAERIGRSKAVVALARKIGVLLHRLWVRQEDFRAFPA